MADQASPPAPVPPQRSPAQQDSEPTTILILGALGIPLVVTAPIAWYMGNQYVKRCRAEGRQPDGTAEAGRILGMVMTLVWGSLIAMYVLMIVVMVVLMVVFYAIFFFIMILAMLGAAVAGV